MDIERQEKDYEIGFSGNKTGLPDSKVIEEMKKLGLNKSSCTREGDRILHRISHWLNNHKYTENKKTVKLKSLNMSFALNMSYLYKQPQNIYIFVHISLYTISFMFLE